MVRWRKLTVAPDRSYRESGSFFEAKRHWGVVPFFWIPAKRASVLLSVSLYSNKKKAQGIPRGRTYVGRSIRKNLGVSFWEEIPFLWCIQNFPCSLQIPYCSCFVWNMAVAQKTGIPKWVALVRTKDPNLRLALVL